MAWLRGGGGVLAVVAAGEAGEGEVLVKIGPVDAEGGNFHMGKLFWGAARQTAVSGNGKGHRRPIGETNGDNAFLENRERLMANRRETC